MKLKFLGLSYVYYAYSFLLSLPLRKKKEKKTIPTNHGSGLPFIWGRFLLMPTRTSNWEKGGVDVIEGVNRRGQVCS